jgi:hypothetical protein
MASPKKKKKNKKILPRIPRTNLHKLFTERYHGASNISGIRYQVLYSVLKSFELYDPDIQDARIRLEGIEDVDLLGFHFGNKFVQAKNYQKNFTWSLLDDPLRNFIQAYQTDSSCSFLLVLGGPMGSELEIINDFPRIKDPKLNILKENLKIRCKETRVSLQNALEVMERLEVISIPEYEIITKLRQTVAEKFQLNTDAVDIYICALTAQFLEWAKERKAIGRADIDKLRATVGEKISAEEQFEAFGKGLIDRITWLPDQNETDFFDGKSTRSGHIAANLDVPRPFWLERIDTVFKSVKVCVVLSSSGQGKSTLLFRYARQQQFAQNPFLLKIAETPEQVELVIKYLRFWSQLIPSALVLIDNVGWHTRLWPLVAQECAALGIKVLVSTRQEDWYRFRRENLTGFELVEPVLSEVEAKSIYSIFHNEKRIHKDVVSAEWAYERIGQPHLLMEYVYLLTYGHMLQERLRDQLLEFQQQKEDPAKVEILRRVSLAHMLGCYLQTDNLLKTIPLQRDPKEVLESIEREYLILENGSVKGLHWVRSDHLAHILHDPVPAAATTALATLDAVPQHQIRTFVANALSNDLIRKDQFLEGLVEFAKGERLTEILIILEGTFEGGENCFFEAHKDVFETSLETIGWSGPKLLSSCLLPTGDNPWRNSVGALGALGETLKALEALAKKCQGRERGKELCAEFLKKLAPHLREEKLLENADQTGRFLDWCYFCGIQIMNWAETRRNLITDQRPFENSIEDFCAFCQGLSRYDSDAYQQWFENFSAEVLSYLTYHVDCLTVEVSNNIASINFLVTQQEEFNAQAVSRLRKIRSALPLCKQYRSQGTWGMPYGLIPPVDDTNKDISSDQLLFKSDVAKNRVWDEVVERYFLPDSFYNYEDEWYQTRCQALEFVDWTRKFIAKRLVDDDISRGFRETGASILKALMKSLKFKKDPPPQSPDNVRQILKSAISNWSSDFENFSEQIIRYDLDRNQPMGNLVFINFHNSRKHLKEVHEALHAFFAIAPDYFKATRLNEVELKNYSILEDYLYSWIIDPPEFNLKDVSTYAKRRRRERIQDNLSRVKASLTPLEETGTAVIIPEDIFEEDSLTHLPIAISVDNPIRPEQALIDSVEALKDARDVADFVYVIPLYNRTRLIAGAYRFSPNRIDEILANGLEVWDYLAALELPEPVKALLPELPYTPLPKLKIMGNVNVILGQLHPIALVNEYASRLGLSSNRFDKAQFERISAHLQALSDQVKTLADETLKLIASEFPNHQETPLLKPSVEFLDSVMVAKDSKELVQLGQSRGFDEELMLKSLMDQVLTTF